MINSYDTLIVIPARKGSQRVKNKNIRKINGKPLIWHTIKDALNVKIKCKIIVSTDCPVVKHIANKNGIETFNRPAKLARSKTSMLDVLKDIIFKLEKENIHPKHVILLQPTSPLRSKNLIDKGFQEFIKNKSYSSLIHLGSQKHFTGSIINNVWKPDFNEETRSQDIPLKYVPTGCLFIYKVKDTIKRDSLLGLKPYALLEKTNHWINIDYEIDLIFFKAMLDNKILKV